MERIRQDLDLAGRIAHAISTPLSALLGTAQMCLEDSDEPDERLLRVLRLGRRIAATVRRMHELSRSHALECSAFPPGALLDQIESELGPRAEANGVELVLHCDVAEPIEADRVLLVTALVSLAENGIEAMGEGGELRIRIAPCDAGIEIEIEDDGPGIPAELADTLFEPFVTGKSTGAGLGTSIADTIVRRHGGRIAVEKADGGGARFRITLPRIREVVAQ